MTQDEEMKRLQIEFDNSAEGAALRESTSRFLDDLRSGDAQSWIRMLRRAQEADEEALCFWMTLVGRA